MNFEKPFIRYAYNSTILVAHSLLILNTLFRFVLLFIFASNLAGIFVAASFDAIRLIPDTQSNPTTTPLESDPQASSPQLYNLNFNLPVEQMEGSLSPYLRAVRTTGSQPISEENCNIRRRHANRHSFTNVMSKFMKSLGRSLRTVAVNAIKSVYEPVSRGVCSMGQYFISLLTLFWGQTSMQSEHSVRSKSQRSFPTKTATDAVPMPSPRANQTQNRKIGTVVTEISSISTPRKSLEEVKRVRTTVILVLFLYSLTHFLPFYFHFQTPRQSHGKSNGDLSAPVSNITQASGDTAR